MSATRQQVLKCDCGAELERFPPDVKPPRDALLKHLVDKAHEHATLTGCFRGASIVTVAVPA